MVIIYISANSVSFDCMYFSTFFYWCQTVYCWFLRFFRCVSDCCQDIDEIPHWSLSSSLDHSVICELLMALQELELTNAFFQSAQPWVPICWSLLGTRLLCYCSHSLDLLLQGCGCQKEIKESWEVWYQLMYGRGSHLTTYHTYNPHRPNLP